MKIGKKPLLAIGIILAVLAGQDSLRAGELNGSARVLTATTEGVTEERDQLQQNYTLQFHQSLTPLLDFYLSFQSSRLDFEDGSIDFKRTSDEPRVELVYRNNTFSGRIAYQDRSLGGSDPAQDLDIKSLNGLFSWRPARGPQYSLRFFDATNVADVAVFGPNLDTTTAGFDVSYNKAANWDARYSLDTFQLDNNNTGLSLDDVRHLVQGTWGQKYLQERLRVSADLLLTRSDQEQSAPTGTTLADPLPVVDGLAAVDITPNIGTLPAVPGLLDGDTANPAGPPPIEIGGANTFRNIGVDLGISRQATRLEISVAMLSDPGLVWQVYQSPDNLNWQPIGGVLSTFDVSFLRYTLQFPETTNRFFKAVNLSVNSQANVLVTEIRAFVDVPVTETTEFDATTQRYNVQAGLYPNERFDATLNIGFNDDSGSLEGFPGRKEQALQYDALIRFGLTDTMDARFQYYVADFDRGQAPVLSREETRYRGELDWDPLPTVDAVFSLIRREESDQGTLLRRIDILQARAATLLRTGLEVTSGLIFDSVEDPAAGFDRTSWTWTERIDSQLTPNLIAGGGFLIQKYDATGTFTLTRRDRLDAGLTWSFRRYRFAADWVFFREDDQESLNQLYSIGWSPGPRLSLNGSYRDFDSSIDVGTSIAPPPLSMSPLRLLDRCGDIDSGGGAQLPPESVCQPVRHRVPVHNQAATGSHGAGDQCSGRVFPGVLTSEGWLEMKTIRFGLLFAIVFGIGCGGIRPTRFVNPDFNFTFVERVAVLPFENLSNDQQAGPRATRIFITELLATGAIEIVEPGEVQAALRQQSVAGANPTTDQIMALGQILGVQGVIAGSVNESQLIRSGTAAVPVVTLDVRMVEVETGVTVWAATHTEKGSAFGSKFLGTPGEPISGTTRECVQRIIKTLVQ
jgi:TolB-like protein